MLKDCSAGCLTSSFAARRWPAAKSFRFETNCGLFPSLRGGGLRKNDLVEFLVKILAQALISRHGHGQFFRQARRQGVHEEGIELFRVFNVRDVAHPQRRPGGKDAAALHFPFRAFHVQNAQAVFRQGELIGRQGIGGLGGNGVQRDLHGGERPPGHAECFPAGRMVMQDTKAGRCRFIGNQGVQRSLPDFG